MSGVPSRSSFIWFHVVGVVLLSVIVIRYVDKENALHKYHRHNFIQKVRKQGFNMITLLFFYQGNMSSKIVTIEGLPFNLRVPNVLTVYLKTIYPDQIESVLLLPNTRILENFITQRLKIITSFERLLYSISSRSTNAACHIGNASKYGTTEICSEYQHYQVSNIERVQISSLQVELMKCNKNILSERIRLKKFTSAAYNHDFQDWVDTIVRMYLDIPPHHDLRSLIENDSNIQEDEELQSPTQFLDSFELGDVDEGEGGAGAASQERGLKGNLCGRWNRSSETSSHLDWIDMLFQINSLSSCFAMLGRGRVTKDRRARDIDCPSDGFISTAFVKFKSFQSAFIAQQVFYSVSGKENMTITSAPVSSADVIWDNLYIDGFSKFLRANQVENIVNFVTFLWMGVISAISYYLYFKRLSSSISSSIMILVQPIALLVAFSAIPSFFTLLGTYEGVTSLSTVQKKVFNRYIHFMLINFVVATTLSSAISSSVFNAGTNNSLSFHELGISIPSVSWIYWAYLIIYSTYHFPFVMFRVKVVMADLCKRYLTPHVTPRDQRKEWLGCIKVATKPTFLPLHTICAHDTCILVIALVFANLAPMFLIVALCYFAVAAVVYTNQLLCVHHKQIDRGGELWPKMAYGFSLGVIFLQLSMILMVILKELYSALFVLIPLLIYCMCFANRNESENSSFLPLEVAVSLDVNQHRNKDKEVELSEHIIPPELFVEDIIKLDISDEVKRCCNSVLFDYDI